MFCLMALWFLPRLTWLHPQKARALEDIRGADLVIVRGGQYLHNESGRLRGLVYLARMLLNIAIPIRLERPTVVWGLSMGPVHGALATRWLRDTMRGCRRIVVREALSADYLYALGVVEGVSVTPDLAFVTQPAHTLPAGAVLPPRPWIGVTVVHWSFPGNPEPAAAQQSYLETIAEALVTAHLKLGLSPVLVEQVTAQHHGQYDRPLLASLVERLKAAGVPATILTEDLSPAELSAFYGQCDVVLATRLHTVILAACAGTPAVAISYQGFKTQGIMRSLNLERYTHDISPVSSADITKSLVDVLSRQAQLRADIANRVEENRRAIARSAEMILAPFRHGPAESGETPANVGEMDAHSSAHP
jgi:polysaccharide pyruvyl transferase WcaK-like protein